MTDAIPPDAIAVLRAAATILHRFGRHSAAAECNTVIGVINATRHLDGADIHDHTYTEADT
jgi:hypothetical protein